MLPRPPATAATAAAAFFIFSILIAESTNDSQVRCSRRCAEESCDTIAIRYGKYCGVGWTGCAGEKPCDDLDACCQIHDDCVDVNGLDTVGQPVNVTCEVQKSLGNNRVRAVAMSATEGPMRGMELIGLTNIQCHEDFKKCIKKLHKPGNEGFSKMCPYDTAIPTMVQGMDIAILLSQFGTPKEEL